MQKARREEWLRQRQQQTAPQQSLPDAAIEALQETVCWLRTAVHEARGSMDARELRQWEQQVAFLELRILKG